MNVRVGLIAAVISLMSLLAPVHPASAGAPVAVAAADDFERADGPLGPDWTVQAGDFGISGGAAVGANFGLATHNTASGDATVAVDVAYDVDAGGVQYAGVVLDYLDPASNIFVKIQDNHQSGVFQTIFCYVGNNGSGGSFGMLTVSEMTSARMSVAIDDSRNVQIVLSEIDGGPGTESHTCAGAPVTGGTGVGIVGFNGRASVDDFRFGDPDTTPPEVVCDEPAPSFEVDGEGGEVTATVTDTDSGPVEESVSAPADVSAVGEYTVELTGADNAGNETTVECPYTVTAGPAPSTTTTSTTTTTAAPIVDATQDAPAPAASPTVASPTFTG